MPLTTMVSLKHSTPCCASFVCVNYEMSFVGASISIREPIKPITYLQYMQVRCQNFKTVLSFATAPSSLGSFPPFSTYFHDIKPQPCFINASEKVATFSGRIKIMRPLNYSCNDKECKTCRLHLAVIRTLLLCYTTRIG